MVVPMATRWVGPSSHVDLQNIVNRHLLRRVGQLQRHSGGCFLALYLQRIFLESYPLQYLFNTGRTTVVSYDDTWSIASKTQFAKRSGMGGCFTWSLDQVGVMFNSITSSKILRIGRMMDLLSIM